MPIKVPSTNKIEEVAEDLDLFGFQLDEQSITGTLKYGKVNPSSTTGFDVFEHRSFYINYSSLDTSLSDQVYAKKITAEEAVQLKEALVAKVEAIKQKAIELILELNDAHLIVLPEKVSRWVDPKSTS